MRYKPLTDKQISYIINMVLCPLIEYRMQLTPLSQQECLSLFAPIRSLFKKKNKFASSLPNVILLFKQFYYLNDLWSLQIKSLSTALLYQFTNSTMYKDVSTIRLFQLQTQSFLATSPLDFWSRPFDRLSYKNLIGASLSLIKSTSSDISLIASPFLTNQIKGGTHAIAKLFPYKVFISFKKILTNHNLFYLDQLISASGYQLITMANFLFRNFNHRSKYFGSQTLFKKLAEIVLEDDVQRILKPEFRLASPLPRYGFVVNSPSLNDRKKEFIASWKPSINCPSFGQIINKNLTGHQFIC
jgi:hypothetical protein